MTKPCILRGMSTSQDPAQAADELHEAIYQSDAALSIFFCSPRYDLAALAEALHRRFQDTPLIGCTTAGEITPRGYMDCSITGTSLPSSDFTAASRLCELGLATSKEGGNTPYTTKLTTLLTTLSQGYGHCGCHLCYGIEPMGHLTR